MVRWVGTIVCLLACTALGEPSFCVGANIGGTASMVQVDKTPQGISVDESKWVGYIMFGLAGEVNFNEYVGAGIGLNYEKRGGIVSGNLSLGAINLVSGEFEYDYRYLQVPVYLKGMLPLMIPGSIYVTFGPEFGFLMESQVTTRVYNSNTSQTDNIDTLTGSVDFGLSGTVGYDLPIAWFGDLRIWASYCHGLIDIYDNKSQPNLDYDIYNRAFKYGISFFVNINTSRRR